MNTESFFRRLVWCYPLRSLPTLFVILGREQIGRRGDMDWLKRLFDTGGDHPLAGGQPFQPQTDAATQPEPVTRRVLAITHNPTLPSLGGRTVREHFRWNDSKQ